MRFDEPMDKTTRALVEKVAPIIEEMESKYPEHIIGIRVVAAALSEFEVEYGVIQRIDGEDPQLMPFSSTLRGEAMAYRDWIRLRDVEIRNKAYKEQDQIEKGSMPPTNEHYMMWFQGRGIGMQGRPLSRASYHIVKRYVSAWEEVSESEVSK